MEVNKIQEFANIINDSKKLAFFGGAGVSTASNIPDFRSSTGLFSKKLNKQFTPEQAVSHSFFLKYPVEFYDFYKNNLIYPNAKPNDCHLVLAKLEEIGKLQGIITQNIDGLHQMAGSKKVYELHGSVHRNYCCSCGKFYDSNFILESSDVPICVECGGIVKPDVVLYEEALDDVVLRNAIEVLQGADTLIVAGTSLKVYPAAGLLQYFYGDKLVVINKSKISAEEYADLVINDDIAKVMREMYSLLEKIA